ncbi:MAG: hypothetical protein WC516_06900 [Patescibacteria group bacterium]|jgi:hypothetical protein
MNCSVSNNGVCKSFKKADNCIDCALKLKKEMEDIGHKAQTQISFFADIVTAIKMYEKAKIIQLKEQLLAELASSSMQRVHEKMEAMIKEIPVEGEVTIESDKVVMQIVLSGLLQASNKACTILKLENVMQYWHEIRSQVMWIMGNPDLDVLAHEAVEVVIHEKKEDVKKEIDDILDDCVQVTDEKFKLSSFNKVNEDEKGMRDDALYGEDLCEKNTFDISVDVKKTQDEFLPFCYAECAHLSLTEKSQNEAENGNLLSHICYLYNKRLFHNSHAPKLERLKECTYRQ